MAYFTHDQLIPLLQMKLIACHKLYCCTSWSGTLYNDELEALSDKLNPAWVSDHLPQLPTTKELQFWLVLGEKAINSFAKSVFNQLPPQKVTGSSDANLGHWQASSSFAKAISFWAWTVCRAPELQKEAAYVISFSFPIDSFVEQHKALKLTPRTSPEHTYPIKSMVFSRLFWDQTLSLKP